MRTQTLGLVASLASAALVMTGQVPSGTSTIEGSDTGCDPPPSTRRVRRRCSRGSVPRAHLPGSLNLLFRRPRGCPDSIGPGGPVVVAIARSAEAAPFLLNAASFVVADRHRVDAVGASFARVPPRGPPFRGELTEGLRYILAAPVLIGLLQMETLRPVQLETVMIHDHSDADVLRRPGTRARRLLSAPALCAVARDRRAGGVRRGRRVVPVASFLLTTFGPTPRVDRVHGFVHAARANAFGYAALIGID